MSLLGMVWASSLSASVLSKGREVGFVPVSLLVVAFGVVGSLRWLLFMVAVESFLRGRDY
jgi:hypothetical protein